MGETGLRGTDSDAWFFRLQRKEEEQVFGERAWRRLEVSVDPRAARNGVGGGGDAAFRSGNGHGCRQDWLQMGSTLGRNAVFLRPTWLSKRRGVLRAAAREKG